MVINFEKELIIIKDNLIISRISDFIGKGKNLILLKEDEKKNEFIIGFWDNKFNLLFANFKLNLLQQIYEKKIKQMEENAQENKMDLDLNFIENKNAMEIDNENDNDNNDNINMNLIKTFEEKNSFIQIFNYIENGSSYLMDSLVMKSKENYDKENFEKNSNSNGNNNNDSDNSQIYSLIGERGNSQLILYEKALKEIKLAQFEYMKISNSILITNNINDNENDINNNNILFLNNFNNTKIFNLNFSERKISLDELTFEENQIPIEEKEKENEKQKEKTLDAFFLSENNFFVQITNLQIRILQIKSNNKLEIIESLNFQNQKNSVNNNKKHLQNFEKILSKLKTEENNLPLIITNLKSIYSQLENCRYLIIFFSNFKISVIKINLEIFSSEENSNLVTKDFLFDYYTSISIFDVSLLDENLLIINGTYDNKLEILLFETKKNLLKKSEFFLKGNISDIIPESIYILNNEFIFISTRIGNLAIFKLDSNSLELDFMASFRPDKNELEALTISNCKQISENFIEVNLFSNKNILFLELEFSEDKKNLRKNSVKYLVDNLENLSARKFAEKNEINFLNEFYLNEKGENPTKISLYQNNSSINISHFQKISENSLLPNKLKKFSEKIFAKKIVDLNAENICVLFNEKENDLENFWGIFIFNVKNFSEKKIKLRNINNLNIHVFKIFSVNFSNVNFSEKENFGKFLLIAGDFFDEKLEKKKGILFIFKILWNENLEISLSLLDEKIIDFPILDFCQIKNFAIFTCENYICSTEILLDNENLEIEIVPKYSQRYLNKLVSISSYVNGFSQNSDAESKQIVVGDISESFHLMEMDSIKIRFTEVASDLNLRSLYKGKFLR